jgi:hypothetical protein
MSSDKEYIKKSKTISYCSFCGAKIFSETIFCFECGPPKLLKKGPEENGISLVQAVMRIGFLVFLFLCVVLIKFDTHVAGFFSSLGINLEDHF